MPRYGVVVAVELADEVISGVVEADSTGVDCCGVGATTCTTREALPVFPAPSVAL